VIVMLLLAGLFVLWSMWFWIILVAVTILIIVFDESGRSGRAFTTMALFLLAVVWFNPSLMLYIQLHPLWVLLGFVLYIAIGAIWMFPRWTLFLLDVKAAKREREPEWAREKEEREKAERLTSSIEKEGQSQSRSSSRLSVVVRGRKVMLPVMVREHKARVIGWMTYWPWSMLWTVLDLAFHRVFQHLYTVFAGRLQVMADKITGT
jgi:hypothetical protein